MVDGSFYRCFVFKPSAFKLVIQLIFLVPDLMYRALSNSEISSNTNVAQATE